MSWLTLGNLGVRLRILSSNWLPGSVNALLLIA